MRKLILSCIIMPLKCTRLLNNNNNACNNNAGRKSQLAAVIHL